MCFESLKFFFFKYERILVGYLLQLRLNIPFYYTQTKLTTMLFVPALSHIEVSKYASFRYNYN